MKADFSEFSYGFSLVQELIFSRDRRAILSSFPIFPSLFNEGIRGGYDVAIGFRGFPLFLQFKLSEKLTRSNASEWSLFGEDYFRFKLKALKNSEQHNLLLELEDEINTVFYSAPSFINDDVLNRAFFKRRIVEESVFVRPSEIGVLPDLDEHAISFLPNKNWAYFCSEPKRIRLSVLGENFINELQEIDYSPENLWFNELDEEYFSRLTNTMINIYREGTNRPAEFLYYDEYRYSSFLRSANIARNLFGCELLLVIGNDL